MFKNLFFPFFYLKVLHIEFCINWWITRKRINVLLTPQQWNDAEKNTTTFFFPHFWSNLLLVSNICSDVVVHYHILITILKHSNFATVWTTAILLIPLPCITLLFILHLLWPDLDTANNLHKDMVWLSLLELTYVLKYHWNKESHLLRWKSIQIYEGNLYRFMKVMYTDFVVLKFYFVSDHLHRLLF